MRARSKKRQTKEWYHRRHLKMNGPKDKEDLQTPLSAVTDHTKQMGLRFHIRKTKWTVISKNEKFVKNLPGIRIGGKK